MPRPRCSRLRIALRCFDRTQAFAGFCALSEVDDRPLFESNAIAEYLDEIVEPRLHPANPIKRARNRAWTDFVSDFSGAVSAVYWTKAKEEIHDKVEAAKKWIAKLEEALETEREGSGPYFNDDKLCLVDAAYAPFLQRFAFVEARLNTGLLSTFPLVQAWSDALLADEVVVGSVPANFEDEFIASMHTRGYYVREFFERAAAE